MVTFVDRRAAGLKLAKTLQRLGFGGPDTVILGLPRGGVPVADEVAKTLGSPMDVIIVRKLGVPWQPEVAMGAIGEDGVVVVNKEFMSGPGVSLEEFSAVVDDERIELGRRVSSLRGRRRRTPLDGRVALIVDDGVATGSTARAASAVARKHGAAKVFLAVPVAPQSTMTLLDPFFDGVVCLSTPDPFWAVGASYEDFRAVSDAEVRDILASQSKGVSPVSQPQDVIVIADHQHLPGILTVPPNPRGLVIFAHGSGSSRHSRRNQRVAQHLNEVGLATLLFDLLTPNEATDRTNVFDASLLGGRLLGATGWVRRQDQLAGLPIGYFGASTGAAAAIWAASYQLPNVKAIVSRGGRPDLAENRLFSVRAPTLLIVGGNDLEVESLNKKAQRRMRCKSLLIEVPGAGHLFEEPGTLDHVSDLAANWFLEHLDLASMHKEAG